MSTNSYIKTIRNINDFDDQLIFRIINQSETNPQILSLVCKRWEGIVKEYFSYLATPYLSQWNSKKIVCLLPGELLSPIFSFSELSPATLSLVCSKWYQIVRESLDYLFRACKGTHIQPYVIRSMKKIEGEKTTDNIKRLQFIWRSLKRNYSITEVSLSILEPFKLEEIACSIHYEKAQIFLNFLQKWLDSLKGTPFFPKAQQLINPIVTSHLPPYDKAIQIRQLLKQEGLEEQLTNIDRLLISDTEITRLPREFKKFSKLKKLVLATTCLSHLKITPNLTSLTVLDISQNHLLKFPSSLSLLTNLTELKISDNKLENLPKEITHLKNLTKLDLKRNQLTKLPREITGLENLNLLYLCENKFRKFPKIITNLTNLKNLYICCGNKLEKLPQEIGLLTSLTKIDIADNRLKEIPSTLFCLKQLIKINLSGNLLQTLPDEIGNLENLTSLDLSNNELKSLPITLRKLTKLTCLYTPGNQLKDTD